MALILIVGFYGALNPKLYIDNFLKLLPPAKQKNGELIIHSIKNALNWWMLGRFSSMAIIGIFTTLGLWMLGIPLPLTLGLFAAVLTFIPNIGPFISAIPAVLFGFIQSPTKALVIVLFYLGIQLTESYFITPLIQKKAVSLPPAFLISFQIMTGVLLDGFGLLLANSIIGSDSSISSNHIYSK